MGFVGLESENLHDPGNPLRDLMSPDSDRGRRVMCSRAKTWSRIGHAVIDHRIDALMAEEGRGGANL
jgi:hypothetical protein